MGKPPLLPPLPYQPGESLELEVLENHGHLSLPPSITAAISKTLSMTMSSVMEVTIPTRPGSHICAILKLYDRRFGSDLRTTARQKYLRYSHEHDFALLDAMRNGELPAMFQKFEEDEETEGFRQQAFAYFDEGNTLAELAMFEAAICRDCNDSFNRETKAYTRLKDLQGTVIPRLYADVRLLLPGYEVPRDLMGRPECAPFWEVKGILLERIPGRNLEDLISLPSSPSDLDSWTRIIQPAIDAVHDINRRGVLISDCQPRNVIVHENLQIPFIIDLGQSYLKEEIIASGAKIKYADPDPEDMEDPNPEIEYCEAMISSNDPGAIGIQAGIGLRKAKKIRLEFKYPDYDKLLDDIQSREVNGFTSVSVHGGKF